MARHPNFGHLDRLEAESIHILREACASYDKPVMLYSCGKGSSVMLHLAGKAFYPAPPQFPLLHVDTTWEFPEVYEFRDRTASETGLELIVHVNEDGCAHDVNPFTREPADYADVMKTRALQQALEAHGFDAALAGAWFADQDRLPGGRVFSPCARSRHDTLKSWYPEFAGLYNTHVNQGECMRGFPLGHWSELDIWYYIAREDIPLAPPYFAARRRVVHRAGMLIEVADRRMQLESGEQPEIKTVRFPALGCYPLTGAVESGADSVQAVIREMLAAPVAVEKGSRS